MQITSEPTVPQPSAQSTKRADFLKRVLVGELLQSVPGRTRLRELGFKLQVQDKKPQVVCVPNDYDQLTLEQLKVPNVGTDEYQEFIKLHGIRELHLPNGAAVPVWGGNSSKNIEAV